MKSTTLKKLKTKLINDIENHSHKEELLKLMEEQLMDMLTEQTIETGLM